MALVCGSINSSYYDYCLCNLFINLQDLKLLSNTQIRKAYLPYLLFCSFLIHSVSTLFILFCMHTAHVCMFTTSYLPGSVLSPGNLRMSKVIVVQPHRVYSFLWVNSPCKYPVIIQYDKQGIGSTEEGMINQKFFLEDWGLKMKGLKEMNFRQKSIGKT